MWHLEQSSGVAALQSGKQQCRGDLHCGSQLQRRKHHRWGAVCQLLQHSIVEAGQRILVAALLCRRSERIHLLQRLQE